ncbi:phytanoyl-CoA dioxygenase family protein [Paenibacillus montanisoli]|uniref:Phytanoyl-CoA dioxygenase family protein n=1 Tax=Paenibacillus montanisoli TaxID=2081970 RepID=A0A328U2G0_9BACL|nr:phytanoyl-CoA dioxygenase family protein [Paenibacillus montanisoli]RAP76978.1 hypothetical protein DL346_00260 [Paenibacillus montanisoli]
MLTAKQRFLMDTYGYVVIPDVVEADLIERTRLAMDRMDAELPTAEHSENYPDGKPRKLTGTPYFSKFGPCIEYDPVFLEMAMHPKVLAYAEEIVGGRVRYEEQECSINRRNPNEHQTDIQSYGWHRGISPDFSRYAVEGRSHYLWIKAIVFLTDIGPDDGGTSVIPGTHRAATDREFISQLEPWMVHQVQGKAGSVLLFTESLIHSVTPIRSDNIRYIMITGYVPPFMREYDPPSNPSEAFLAHLNESERTFLTGDQSRRARYDFGRM